MKLQLLYLYIIFNSICYSQNNISFNSHSHNDYANPKPLFTALSSGSKSIEADIIYLNDKLFVAHNVEDTNQNNTLEKMYLAPLKDIIENTNSEYHFNYELFLFIDIKLDAENTYKKLRSCLNKYKNYLTSINDGQLKIKNIRVIISGNRPIETVRNEMNRFIFLDGRFEDVGKGESENLFPIISEDWLAVSDKLSKYLGKESDIHDLKEFINKVHEENKLVRFWGTPDNDKFWDFSNNMKIDFVNTDMPDDYKKYYLIKFPKADIIK